MKVKLVAITKPLEEGINTAQEFISFCARVSAPNNQYNTKTASGLLKYCVNHKHFSIFEMGNMVFEIETTRDISRQILRHRSFSFQEFCVHGDTKITTMTKSGRSKKVKIKDLYKRYTTAQYSNMSDWLVKIYDEEDNKFTVAKIKEVFKTGKKPLYKLTLDDGKEIISTDQHKYFVKGKGFVRLQDISEKDFVGVNGIPVYQDKQWLTSHKNKSLENGGGVDWIAEVAGCSYHTIRKWLSKHSLQFTKKEVASYTEVWNKNLPSELQPMFGKTHKEETRTKMYMSSTKGKESKLYTNADRSWAKEVRDYWYKRKNNLYKKFEGKCQVTGEICNIEDLQIDHIKPVFLYPELAFDESNIRLIKSEIHINKSGEEASLCQQTAHFTKVKSIEYYGEDETFDLEVEHKDHNYIANGIVTHNSQRYATVSPEIIYRETRLQDTKNKQNSTKCNDIDLVERFKGSQDYIFNKAIEQYEAALSEGIAKEQARALLPEGLTGTRMYMNGTVRSWIHYCQVRCGVETQLEHRLIAKEICKELINQFPFLEDVVGICLIDDYSAEH